MKIRNSILNTWAGHEIDALSNSFVSRHGVSPSEVELRTTSGLKAHGVSSNGTMRLSGYFSTEDIDSYKDIILATSWEGVIEPYMKHPLILFMHRWYDKPIGKTVNLVIDSMGQYGKKGLYGEVDLLPTSEGKDIQILVAAGVLNSFSVGFSGQKANIDEDSGVRTFTQIKQLFENSVVNLGANPAALFQQMKNKELQLKSFSGWTPEPKNKEIRHMDGLTPEAIKLLETKVGGFENTLTTLNASVTALQQKQDEANRLFVQLQEKATQLQIGAITKTEFDQFVVRYGTDYKKLTDEVDVIAKARAITENRIPYSDWRGMVNDPNCMVLLGDNGSPLSPVQQRAYKMFNLPVDATTEKGRQIKMLQDLHDVVLCSKAYYQGRNKGVNIRNLKSFGWLHQVVDSIDPELAKAMYSTGSGLGDEWVPTEMSAQYAELYRLEAKLEQYFPTFDMPSQPYEWPLLTSGATMYRVDEATTDNAAAMAKTNLATSKITFTAKAIGAALLISYELNEDSIVPMAGVITSELARAQREAVENILINGDTTATHFDTGTGYTSSSSAVITAIKGLRKIAADVSGTFDIASTTAGVGDATTAFAAEDLRHCRKVCGKRGIDPSKGLYIVSPSTYFKVLGFTVFSKANESGLPLSAFVTGTVQNFDGAPLFVSGQVREDLTPAGIYDASTMTKTVVLYVDTTGFRIGRRRGVTLEVDRLPFSQQLAWISTQRLDFQKMTVTGEKPVGLGFNVPN